ncbi:WapI family immunity protein [Tissierella creatinophila]|uniref:Uncharacterized protein n=1 Tax=Tissierella creatinophila DSM 6911 TaxID=1123403 RepID=A0A1U7M814_TISCR|nr:hypothetical protein [Tissierella creatinophila]OLS03463.1 hypothetical protein TICRE_05770 [Tissierella creatinophila DSM 6911]
MDRFEIRGNNGYIAIDIGETSHAAEDINIFGGYDVIGKIDIKSGNYRACGALWLNTKELYNFFISLKECWRNLKGEIRFMTHERNLELIIKFDKLGHVIVFGDYIEKHDEDNKLIFEIISDQSFIQETIRNLSSIISKYDR